MGALVSREQFDGVMAGIAHLMKSLAPVRCLCDPGDIGAEAQVRSPFSKQPTVFLYDMAPGGIGLAEKLWEVREELISASLETVINCTGESGCPACVGPQVDTSGSAKRSAIRLLKAVLA